MVTRLGREDAEARFLDEARYAVRGSITAEVRQHHHPVAVVTPAVYDRGGFLSRCPTEAVTCET